MSNWDLALQNETRESKSETNYVKFVEGDNKLRILDAEPKAIWVHWLANANNGKGLSVVCLGKDCPMCNKYRYDYEKIFTDFTLSDGTSLLCVVCRKVWRDRADYHLGSNQGLCVWQQRHRFNLGEE